MKLTWLNVGGEVHKYQIYKIAKLYERFKKINVLEIGCAYGGAVEYIATEFKNSEVYGYDTFEGHPVDLSDDPTSHEATCMEYWYRDDVLGKDKLSYEYQTGVLKELGLNNAHLVKGRVNKKSFDDIKDIHFAMIDMDLIKPIKVAYDAIKNKIVKGGCLVFHDYADNHLELIKEFIDEVVIPSGIWKVEPHKEHAFISLIKK